LQAATARWIAAPLAAPAPVAGVELVGARVAVLVAGVEVLWLVVVELPPPPQPASSAPLVIVIASHVKCLRIIASSG
jgi:hypothetical protein